MAQTPWVTCSSAHSMGTLWEMLLLKPKPVAICSSCSIPRTPCGCWGLQVLQSHPFSRLPLVPHSLSQCQCPALRPPKHPSACHIFLCQVTSADAVYGCGLTGVTQTGTILSLINSQTLPRLFVSSSSHKKKLQQGYIEAKPPYDFKMNINTSKNSREAIFPNWNNLTRCPLC